jgi:hypothetical protein
MDVVQKTLKVEKHPRVKLMHKPYDDTEKELGMSITFVSGDKGFLDLNDFLELHRNIYYVQPKENLTNFLNVKLY